VDLGTATAPIYLGHDAGLPLHVWVSETRPRNQGMLTAWELGEHGVPHTIVPDNAAGHLVRTGEVDVCLVGTDRVVTDGSVCNKIGTYLKALAAREGGVPFYVAAPSSSIDWASPSEAAVPIEERSADEVRQIVGRGEDGQVRAVALAPRGSPVRNFAFDVTPGHLVTGLITERGVAPASADGLRGLFPERLLTTSASARAAAPPTVRS
jgi:methylthioribose-1-phosphate isomerase